MPDRQHLARFLSDAGLAAWFGGSLAGALGSTRAPAAFDAAAVGTHLVGASMLPRSKRQVALTASAVGTTAYARYLAGKATTDEQAQKQLQALQWAVPGLTGAVLATSARDSKPTLRSRARDARALAASAAAAALPAAKTALAAAAPTAERARDAAVPALKAARDQAVPALQSARDQAVPALQAAYEQAGPALQSAREQAKPLLKSAREAAAPAVSRAREALPV
jgi:hypothetical protein